MKLAKAEAPRTPPGFVVVPKSAWATSWAKAPKDDVAIGLRLLSESDVQIARAWAAKKASAMFLVDGRLTDSDDFNAAYNDALMRYAVARSACDPNDASAPYWQAAEDVVGVALTSGGVRLIYDAIERMHVAMSPTTPIANDQDVAELVELLSLGALGKLANQKQTRKLLFDCLETLRAVARA